MADETQTLMSAAATTPEGAQQAPTEAAATAAAPAGATPPGEAAQGQQPGETPEAGATAAAKPQGAPEQYADFTAPEGAQLDAQVLEAFKPLARELGLAQEGAQKVLDTMAPVLARRQAEQLASASAQWADASRADREFGGDKLDENLAVAKKAMDALASPELRQLLSESGLGNHPEVIRMFWRAGKTLVGEDRFVAGQAGRGNPSDARRLYGASNMNP